MNPERLQGHLDGMQGNYVSGWAISAVRANSEIAVIGPDGQVLAEGLACIDRRDLAGIVGENCNFAFRIAVPDLPAAGPLHVLADGVELPNSPIDVGPGCFDGHISLRRGFIEGWVTERVNGFGPPEITVEDQDGQVVFRSRSAFTKDNDHLFSPARFSGELDQCCFGGGDLRLTARANGVAFAISTFPALPLKGMLDSITPERCSGWLVSPGAPRRAFDIETYRDGKMVKSVRCDIERVDVAAVFPNCHKPGFDVSLPPVPQGGDEPFTTLSFRLPGSTRDLFDGPYVIGRRKDLVVAARKAANVNLYPAAGRLTAGENSVLQAALSDFIAKARGADYMVFSRQPAAVPEGAAGRRLNIIIPIYRGVAITRACIESVLSTRSANEHRVILVNDASPESDMAGMLGSFVHQPNVLLLTNDTNIGFIKSVNRGLACCHDGDVLLLNSDTRLFPGGLQELWQVAYRSAGIGTVTALSNNATIFSYPHPSLRGETLADIGWEALAAVALDCNRGLVLDVPTGHGFCLLIKSEVLQRVGQLDEAFGRGYGEENDFCARAADLGYRNVAALGVLVEHRESVSFVGDKAALLANNLGVLQGRYPEYTPIIMETERREIFRSARWPLDASRLRRAGQAGASFALVVRNALGGGTSQAIADIEAAVGYGGAEPLTLSCRPDGSIELTAKAPVLCAVFAEHECEQLFDMLSAAAINLVVVHQMLGFPADFFERLRTWLAGRRSVFYAHDYYSVCPRVTMIDVAGQFCDVADPARCRRCVSLGGAHEASRFDDRAVAEHREIFLDLLHAFSHVVAPSESAAFYLRRAFPSLTIESVPHPVVPADYPARPREGSDDEIVLIGAIGPHKGSAKLLEIAQLARLTHPQLCFRVIGYTDRDADLRLLGNVYITGPYKPAELPALVRNAKGRLALFLSGWPETYSYALSEAVRLGFMPLVPDLGAPAERVRAAGFGAIFNFPIVAAEVLDLVSRAAIDGQAAVAGSPMAFAESRQSVALTRRVFGLPPADFVLPPMDILKPARKRPKPTILPAEAAEAGETAKRAKLDA